MKLTPIHEFAWPPEGELFKVTCINHPTASYATKNPWTRNIHLLRSPDGHASGTECDCPFGDLAVVEED